MLYLFLNLNLQYDSFFEGIHLGKESGDFLSMHEKKP